MYRIEYFSPNGGKIWPLAAEKHAGAFLIEGGIDGLIGDVTAGVRTAAGVPGQRRDPHGVTVNPITGSLTCYVYSDVYPDFRASFSHEDHGILVITSEEGVGRLYGEVRLQDGAGLPAPSSQPGDVTGFEVTVPLVLDAGTWGQWVSKSGEVVVVANYGDVAINPQIRWRGAGGRVVMPSGASFTLPAVESERTVLLDANESCIVLDQFGNVDVGLWRELRGVIMPEPVPKRSERAFILPPDAHLEWRVGFFDPWTRGV